jgi:hypothetical protein
MNTLYTKINEREDLKKEIRNIENHISKYINQKNIRKYLFIGLKEKVNLQNKIDDKTIFLYRDFILERNYNFYKYIFSIREQNDSILTIEIVPDIFKLYFKVNLLFFQQSKITSEKIIEYIKLTIFASF